MARVTVNKTPNARHLGPCFEILRFLGILPITKYGKFSMVRWYRSLAVTSILTICILPIEAYEYLRRLPNRYNNLYNLLQATMAAAHKFIGVVMLIFHVRATLKHKRELQRVCQHLMIYRYRKLDWITFTISVWVLSKHAIYTYNRTSAANFATFLTTAYYVRSRMLLVLFLLTPISLAHAYSTFLHYLTQLIRKSTNRIKKTPSNAILQHARLLELTKSVHLCYSLQLLLLAVDCTYTAIYNTYITYSLFKSNSRERNFDKISERVFAFGSLLYYAMLPTTRCEKLKKVAEAFNNELFKLMRDSKDLCSNSKLRLYVTMKQTVNFTACGFFSLGYPLVTSIIAAATTYLVILIQFSLLTS